MRHFRGHSSLIRDLAVLSLPLCISLCLHILIMSTVSLHELIICEDVRKAICKQSSMLGAFWGLPFGCHKLTFDTVAVCVLQHHYRMCVNGCSMIHLHILGCLM